MKFMNLNDDEKKNTLFYFLLFSTKYPFGLGIYKQNTKIKIRANSHTNSKIQIDCSYSLVGLYAFCV